MIEAEGKTLESTLTAHDFMLDRGKLGNMNRINWQEYVKPETTAMIMVDMQNDALPPKGSPVYGFGATPMWEALSGLGNTKKLVETARAHGISIYWIRCGFSGVGKDIAPNTPKAEFYTLLQAQFPGALSRDTLEFEIADEIKALMEPHDVVIDKTASSSFVGTDLQQLLVMEGVKTLIICGFITDACVEGTARNGFDLGYHSVVVADASACPSWERHYRSLYLLSKVYATVAMTEELVGVLDRNAR